MTVAYKQQTRAPEHIIKNRERLYNLYKTSPLPVDQLLTNLGLYTRSGALAKLLFLNEIYEKIVAIPGCIIEFGTWWGQSLIVLENLRAVHEPYNYVRRIIGFDTFAGYPAISTQDKHSETIKAGGYATTVNYESYLEELFDYHETENPMGHIKKHEIVKGDVIQQVPNYFKNNPDLVVSLAIFDMALYEPTKVCLREVVNRMVRGGIIVLDEFNSREYPGETLAMMEEIGLRSHRLFNSKILPDRAYVVID